jgi:hypothetical protein
MRIDLHRFDILAAPPLSKCIFEQWASSAHRELCVRGFEEVDSKLKLSCEARSRTSDAPHGPQPTLPALFLTTNNETTNCNQEHLIIYWAQYTVATLAFYSDPSETLYSGFEKVVMSEGTTTTQKLEDMCSYLCSHLREELPRNPRQTAYKAARRPCR